MKAKTNKTYIYNYTIQKLLLENLYKRVIDTNHSWVIPGFEPMAEQFALIHDDLVRLIISIDNKMTVDPSPFCEADGRLSMPYVFIKVYTNYTEDRTRIIHLFSLINGEKKEYKNIEKQTRLMFYFKLRYNVPDFLVTLTRIKNILISSKAEEGY